MTTQRRNLALERLLATMLESPDRGGGAPSHTAEEGRLYWDKTNDDLYGNSDGSTTWQLIGGGSPETFIDFEEIVEPAAPAADTMRMFAADEDGTSVLETKDSDDHVFRVNEDTFRIARNTSGSQIDKGEAVYFSGSTGNKPNIALARADDESTMPAIGVAAENIANTDFGIISVIGRIESIDTSAFNEGDILYVSPTVAGGLTATRPTHPNFAQFIGTVEVSGIGNGAILLNTEPTLLGRDSGTILDNFTIGDQAAGAKTVTFDNGNKGVVSWEPTQDRTVTIPDATGAVALTTVANTFSAIQTFPNTGLHILDTDASHDLILKPGSNLTADRTLTLTTGDASRTLTLDGNATLNGTLSGGGTLATGGFTATVPETMTLAGRNVANVFTENQTVRHAAGPELIVEDSTNPTTVALVARDSDAVLNVKTNHPLKFWTNGTLRGQFTAGGNFKVEGGVGPEIQVEDTTNPTTGALVATNDAVIINVKTNHSLNFRTNNTYRGKFTAGGHLLINTTTDAAQLAVDQSSTTAAIPVLSLDQADLSEGFIDFIASAGAGNPIDTAALGTYYGKIAVEINGVRKVIPIYNS